MLASPPGRGSARRASRALRSLRHEYHHKRRGADVRMSTPSNEANGWRWLPLTLGVILLDQYTKKLIIDHVAESERIDLMSVLAIVHARNPGAAWSMLAHASGWQRWFFTVLALGVSVALIVWLGKVKARSQAL